MHILVVDDTATARTMLDRSFKKWGYEVALCTNINDALELLKTQPIQLVITDWIMPGGDGPTLCRGIRNLNLSYYTYIILITSLDSNESAIEGLESGADDFVRKPINLDELRARIRAGERVLALEKTLQDRNNELIELSNSLLAAQELINRDLQTAAKMQQKLLPATKSKCLSVTIDWLFLPSAVVSGDIFNFFRLDETHVGFYSLDVVGHGVSSAMFTLTLSRMLTPEIQRDNPLKRRLPEKPFYELIRPDEVMSILNNQFQTDSDSWLYFTMIYGIVDTAAKTIVFSQGGHPNPIYITPDQPARFVGEGGFPVGITEAAEYELLTLNYCSGDRLILYSDGIIECTGADDEMFGADRLLALLDDNKNLALAELPNVLSEKMKAWHGNDFYEDDISMLILEMP